MQKKKNTSINIEIELYIWLKHYCIDNNTNLSDLVNDLLEKFKNNLTLI